MPTEKPLQQTKYDINYDHMPVVRINAPEWYEDEGWLLWLASEQPATWFRPGRAVGEYSDVFFTFDSRDGSDYPGSENCPGIPEHIWACITEIVEAKYGENAAVLIWVSNLK